MLSDVKTMGQRQNNYDWNSSHYGINPPAKYTTVIVESFIPWRENFLLVGLHFILFIFLFFYNNS